MQLAGTVADISAAFGMTLRAYRDRHMHISRPYRRDSLPADLGGVVVAVLGLIRVRKRARIIASRSAPSASYTPPQIAELYDFPAGLQRRGETIAIIELGGGYSATDFSTYCAQLGVTGAACERRHRRRRDELSRRGSRRRHRSDARHRSRGHDRARREIRVLLCAEYRSRIHRCDEHRGARHEPIDPRCSRSVGADAESNVDAGRDDLRSIRPARRGVAMGVTICVASGDGGSSDGVSSGTSRADFPASSPHVLGCGGTTI